MSDDESSEDGAKPFRFAPTFPTPSSAAPILVPQPVGSGDHIFTPVPQLIGNGGHIFSRRAPQLLSGPAPSTNASTATDYPDFNHYRHLQYQGPRGTKDPRIHHPTEGDVGDGDTWYYVTVGRTVGEFNAW